MNVDFNLYLITDRKLFSTRGLFFKAIEDALKGGIKSLQLREKDLGIRELLEMAYCLREITNKYNAKLFINDRVDVAIAVNADGVHLGVDSMPAHAARKAAGKKMLISASAHSIEEAKRAYDEGADFLTLGPIYETPSKKKYGSPLGLEILKNTVGKISIPVFAIGGIKEDKVKDVKSAGADGIALISGIFGAEDIKERTEYFLKLLG